MRVVIAATLGVALASPAFAEIYRYVDDDGRVHVADDPSKLPEPASAEPVGEEAGDGIVNVVPSAPPSASTGRPSSGASRPAASPTCKLELRNRSRSEDRSEWVYTGTVVNRGTGRAGGVRVRLVDLDASSRELASAEARLDRVNLGPGEESLFRLTVVAIGRDQVKRSPGFVRSTLVASFARCLP